MCILGLFLKLFLFIHFAYTYNVFFLYKSERYPTYAFSFSVCFKFLCYDLSLGSKLVAI